MEIPELIDIIYAQVLHRLRERIEKEDHSIITSVDNERSALSEKLNEEQEKLLGMYVSALELRYDYINYEMNKFVLNVGIKYGMELKKALDVTDM